MLFPVRVALDDRPSMNGRNPLAQSLALTNSSAKLSETVRHDMGVR